MKTKLLALAALAVAGLASADEDENAGRLLYKAGLGLMEMPVLAQGSQASGRRSQLSSYEVRHPSHEDLAVSRLQDSALETVDGLWELVRDPQALRILESQPGGARAELLRRMRASLGSEAFALSQQVSNSGAWRDLRSVRPGRWERGGAEWTAALNRLVRISGKVETLYSYLEGYMAEPEEAARDTTLEDFARSIVEPGSSQETSLRVALVELHNLSMPSLGLVHPVAGPVGNAREEDRQDIYHRLKNVLKENGDHLCSMGQSPHQLIYNLYNVIALTEIKGYAMIQFSYMMLKLYNRGNFTLESDLARKSFENQATDKLVAVKGILPQMDREYWRCDAETQVEGKTYIRITELLQGIIENEVDMNNVKTCRDSCSTYRVAETEGRCFKNKFCAKQDRCQGRLFDCKFYDADAWVCMSESEGRRYDYVEYEDHTILGRKTNQCRNKIKVDSWWRWLLWHCSYCFCKCDQQGPKSDRYFSLRPATSDVANNRVVTGVRFAKVNRVIQIEIEEAEALPEGGVKEETREWVSPPSVDVDADEQDEDFMTLTYEERSVDTDRLEAPPGHVVTGVRLRNIGGHVNLEVQVTPIKFAEGKLISDRSTWIGNDNTPATQDPRRQVDILMPDVPTESRAPSRVDTTHNQFVQFDATAASKDAAQTTVPYIDAQPVSPATGTWLAGVGIYHKGALGYGGYVGLAVKTFDFSRHLLPEAAKEKEELRFDFESVRPQRRKKKGIRK